MRPDNNNEDGDRKVAIPFRRIWCVDTEYQSVDGKTFTLCMVAKELRTGETRRWWRDELLRLRSLPIDLGSDALFVSYLASAELRCFIELGWSFPDNVLDAFVEHRALTNGCRLPTKNDLLGALALRGLPHIESAQKEAMYELILGRESWSTAEREDILDYCESDVDGLMALVPALAADIDWDRAILRGRYMKAVARMEQNGIPIDTTMQKLFVLEWERIKIRLVNLVDRHYGVYDGLTFKASRFMRKLEGLGIPSWPRLQSGAPDLKDDTFKQQASLYPVLAPLRELRRTLSRMPLSKLEIAGDGRSRCMLSPFRSLTGRNQPSASRFAFGPAKWTRGLIKPPEGYGLAYIDFSSQEIGIAAGLSGDERLREAYRNGDPYLSFAKQAGLAPEYATSATHKLVRDRCKAVVLGMNYGIGPASMAHKAGITPIQAGELMMLHRRTYSKFWAWSDAYVDSALLNNMAQSVFAWPRRLTHSDKVTSLKNFPMQANGAEMMRLAAIAATEAGIEVCAPVHDAFLIAAPLERLDDDVMLMREIMSQAGEAVCGLAIRTDAQVVRYPDRYMDEKGIEMWNLVVQLVHVPEARYEPISV